MAASPSALPRSVVAARLRAAGCVFAEDEARLLISAARTPADLEGMVDRRAAGLPLEHVLGWAAFCGLRIAVDAGVFVPRRRTEFLVSRAAALGRPGAVVVDLCCGSGAGGAAPAAALGRGALYAPGIHPAPVRGGVELCRVASAPAGARWPGRSWGGAAGRLSGGGLCEPLPRTLRGRVD